MVKKLKFNELKISTEVQKAIVDMGFEETTPIQTESIPVIMQGKDIIGQAMTGSGKTVAFGIPIIDSIDSRKAIPQALVLCPTRELAIQVSGEINKLAKYKEPLMALPVFGGQRIERQLRALRKGVHVIVGTPGRILDHISRRTLFLKKVKIVVLDEADEMLDMGFRDDIEAILQQTPKQRQTLLFSATMPAQIMKLARSFQKSPEIIKVVHERLTVPSTEQVYFEIGSSRKLDLLMRIIDVHNPKRSIVFCNTKRRVDSVEVDLRSFGYSAAGIHGDMTQVRRTKVMDKFKKGVVDILVATDVAARGIDVKDVEAVFNFEIPQDEGSYVHRIGRTGRAGKAGKAFSLVSGSEMYRLRNIKRYTRAPLKLQPLPSVQEIAEKHMDKVFEKVRKVIHDKKHEPYLQVIESLLKQDFTSLDVAAALLKLFVKKRK